MTIKGLAGVLLALAAAVTQTPAQTPSPGVRPAAERPAGHGAPAAVAQPTTPPIASPIFLGSRSASAPALAPESVAGKAAAVTHVAAAEAASRLPSATRWVPVTITPKLGASAPAPSPADVIIVEDGVRQRITAMERWPLWLVIVLDVGRQVGPMKQLAVHRQLVYDLLYALGEDDHVAIVQYADGMELIQPWTLDVREAERAVTERFKSGLDGQLWNSVAYGAGDLLDGKLGHRAVVVITDGVDDTGDTLAYDRAVEILRETATTLYIVNLSRYLEERIQQEAYGVNGVINVITSPSYIGRRRELREYREKLGETPPLMQKATTESGGLLWLVDPKEDPTSLPERIWREIGGQLMVRIEPERPEEIRPGSGVRSYSVFPTRGDVTVRAPARLYTQIASPRSSSSGTTLTRSSGKGQASRKGAP